MTQDKGAVCTRCGMPLEYDRTLHPDAVAKAGHCSSCASRVRPARRRVKSEDNAWILDLIFAAYRRDSRVQRGLSAALSTAIPSRLAKVKTLFEILKGIPSRAQAGRFDVLVLYSGGKDSSYMLMNLARRRGLRVCAWMLNQGYQSPQAIKNARGLCERLGVELVIDEPEKQMMDTLFRLGFEIDDKQSPEVLRGAMTYGSACWPCLSTIAAHANNFCHKHGVSFCFIGTQKGQNRLDLNGAPVLAGGGLPRTDALVSKFVTPFRDYVNRSGVDVNQMLDSTSDPGTTTTVLVPFYELVQRPPIGELMAILERAGWHAPNNTGACSTNCMINELGRKVMRDRFGFDLYQVIDAHERQLSNLDAPAPAAPDVDLESVRRAAKMIRMSDEEVRKYRIQTTVAQSAGSLLE